MKWFVSRQHYWGVEIDSAYIVEIAAGGRDYSNPDMLGPRYSILGEGKEYDNPEEAAEAAIRICEAWRVDGGQENAHVGIGSTGGGTLPFDPKTYEEVREWAQKTLQALPKCDQCGEVLGREVFSHNFATPDENFCSERCAEKAYDDQNAQYDLEEEH